MRLAVVLAAEAGAARALDLEAVVEHLRELQPDLAVRLVQDLGRGPAWMHELVAQSGAERLVLGVGAPTPTLHELRVWSSDAGLDPFAVALVDLDRFPHSSQSAEAAALTLAAAAAGLRASPATRPEQIKLEPLALDASLSRRSLLALPRPGYRPVASITGGCQGARRCGLCVSACPVDAIALRRGRLAVDRDRCVGCGVCVAACPVGAIALPGASLERYEAELAVLLSTGGFGLLVACRAAGRAAPLPEGWLPLDVSCLAIVTPGWLLQALAAGAPAVGVVPCAECRVGRLPLEQRLDYAHTLLRLLGDDVRAERVRIGAGAISPARPAGPRSATLTLREPRATAEALPVLAKRHPGVREVVLEHPASALGLVEVRESCIACGACAAACPTGALAFDEDATAAVLSFDAARCVACRRCVAACPDGRRTLGVRRATSLAALRGSVPLRREAFRRCRRCGAPIAPAAMLDRVLTTLEPESGNERLRELVGELCLDCRSGGGSPARRSFPAAV